MLFLELILITVNVRTRLLDLITVSQNIIIIVLDDTIILLMSNEESPDHLSCHSCVIDGITKEESETCIGHLSLSHTFTLLPEVSFAFNSSPTVKEVGVIFSIFIKRGITDSLFVVLSNVLQNSLASIFNIVRSFLSYFFISRCKSTKKIIAYFESKLFAKCGIC